MSTDPVTVLVQLVNELLAALDAGDDDVAHDALERLYLFVGTETCLEWVRSRGGAGPKPLGEAEGRPPQTDEAAA